MKTKFLIILRHDIAVLKKNWIRNRLFENPVNSGKQVNRLRFRPSHIGGAVVEFGIFYMGKKMFFSFPIRGPIQNFMAIPTQSLNKKALKKFFESLFHLSVIYKKYLILKFKCCMKTTPIFDPFLRNPSFNNH